MILRVLLILVLACSIVSCKTADKRKREKNKPTDAAKGANADVAYQSFINRLRKAVSNHDVAMVASMMTPDFGYLMDPIPGDSGIGEGVFAYWDKNGLWPELNLVVKEEFVPFGNYLVAPSQFATDPAYSGYRAGIVNQNGSWKFAYFVTGQQER